jgi:hypothetical protein
MRREPPEDAPRPKKEGAKITTMKAAKKGSSK